MEPRASTASAPLQCDTCKAAWPDGSAVAAQRPTTPNRSAKAGTEQREQALGLLGCATCLPQAPPLKACSNLRGAVRYSILDRPPWAECILLGFQVDSRSLSAPARCICVVVVFVCNSVKRPFWCACQLESTLLCVQNYLTMLGSTVLIPFTLVTAMGGTPDDLAAGVVAKEGHVLLCWTALALEASTR